MLSALFSKPTPEQTIALAGVFQAAQLVYQLTKTNNVDEQAMHNSIYSLLRINADSAEQVFAGPSGVYLGLRTMMQYFSAPPDNNVRDVIQYTLGMNQLSAKLSSSAYADQIHRQLELLSEKYLQNYGDDSYDVQLQQELAQLYRETISRMTPRIIVQGSPEKLQQEDIVNAARTALFAGIRAAFLWQQVGGQRFQILLQRQRYVALAKEILRA